MTAPRRQDEPVRLGPSAAGRCRRRIHLDHDPTADPDRRTPPTAGLQQRLADLDAHRRAVHELLAATIAPAEHWDPAGPDRPAAVWAARLRTDTRLATVDLLLRAPDGGYLPVLIRGHRTTDPGSGAVCSDLTGTRGQLLTPTVSTEKKLRSHHADALALAHVHRMLVELGLACTVGPARGGIIGRGGPAADAGWDDGTLIVWHQLGSGRATDAGAGPTVLADYDARFADRYAVASAAAAGRPALARPSRVAECRRCPWWPVCGPELEAAHDVSLLVAGSDVEVLHGAGLLTYDDVAAMDPAAAAALPLTGMPAADARARALALVAGVPMVRRGDRVDPPRADVELDVDMESYLDDGAYLWGTYLSGPGVARLRRTPDTAASGAGMPAVAPGYRPFVTWRPLDSPAAGQNFVAFWRYLTELRQACQDAGLTFAAYCYSRKAEERWLYGTPQRFPDVPGMPSRAEIDRFCGSTQWVDLYAEVKRCFVVPGSLRLKRIAAVAGFAWRDPEPGGENSMAWYRIATGTGGDAVPGGAPAGDESPGGTAAGDEAAGRNGDPDPVRAHRERILRYNEDDVRATRALRRWMTDRAHDLPTVADLAEAARPARR